MSYDLYFRTRDGETKPGAQELEAHFRARPNYTLHDGAAEYGNEDTGVYFHFDWSPPDPELLEDTEEDEVHHDVAFNINYNRPSFFGLEAAPELKAFTERFSYIVDDPQMDGMGEDATFTEQGFIKGWNAGNQFGVYAVMQHGDAGRSIPNLRRELLTDVWRWNFHREELQAQVGDDLFVPKILPIELDGAIHTAAVWGDLLPSVLPAVTYLLSPLERYKGFLERGDALRIVPFRELEPLLKAYVGANDPVRHWHLEYNAPPSALVKFVRKCRKGDKSLSVLSWDIIVDTELIEGARKKS